jgi:hypothetical protein
MNHKACVLCERDLTHAPSTGADAATGITGFWYRVLLHGKNNGAASAVHGAAADQHNVHLRTPKHEGQNDINRII